MLFQPGEGGPFGGPRRRGIGDGLIARRPGDPSLFVKSENALLGKSGPTPAGGGFPHGFALVGVRPRERGLTPPHPVVLGRTNPSDGNRTAGGEGKRVDRAVSHGWCRIL